MHRDVYSPQLVVIALDAAINITLEEHISLPRHVIIAKWESLGFWYPDLEPDNSKFIGSKFGP